MSHVNGPYSAKEVAHLTAKQKKQLRDEARAFALKSTEILEIIFAQKPPRSKGSSAAFWARKRRKVREVVKKHLEPTYRRF
jgi:hypothetical protein